MGPATSGVYRTAERSRLLENWASCVYGLRNSESRLMLLFAYHQNRAVSVPDDAAGDAAHQCPPYPAHSPATHYDEARSYHFSNPNDLLVFSPLLRWASCTVPPPSSIFLTGCRVSPELPCQSPRLLVHSIPNGGWLRAPREQSRGSTGRL